MSEVKNVSSHQVQTQQTSKAVGTLGKHSIQVGKNPPISLNNIKASKIPFQGFKKVTKTARANQGITEKADSALRALVRDNGKLELSELLGALKAMQIHLDRKFNLENLPKGQMDDMVLATFAPMVEKLSNTELAAVYQSFVSG